MLTLKSVNETHKKKTHAKTKKKSSKKKTASEINRESPISLNESTGGGKTRIIPKIKVNFCEPGRGNLCCKQACATDATVVSISGSSMTGLCCLLML